MYAGQDSLPVGNADLKTVKGTDEQGAHPGQVAVARPVLQVPKGCLGPTCKWSK